MALSHKNVDVDWVCPMCQNVEEDDFHALISCAFSRRIWSSSSFGDQVTGYNSIIPWWNNVCRIRTKSDVEGITAILWEIWRNRNSQVWANKFQPPHRVVSSAKYILHQWQSANSTAKPISTVTATPLEKWSKPPTDWVTCNVDASIAVDPIKCGFSCVLRDSGGNFIAGLCGTIMGINSPQLAETLGVREALSWLKHRQIDRVILESDSQSFVQAFHSSALNLSSFGLLVNDCKSIVKDFTSCKVVFIRRSANVVAHTIARAVLSMSDREEWVGVAPLFISDVLRSDLN